MLTTIGADAMPLIRYRTGDFTRILPPCKCGGVTKRLDTVSRREGAWPMEELDSVLFTIPELVDYRTSFDGSLRVEVLTTRENVASTVQLALRQRYPQVEVSVTAALCRPEDRPMYPGKRYVIKPDML